MMRMSLWDSIFKNWGKKKHMDDSRRHPKVCEWNGAWHGLLFKKIQFYKNRKEV